MIFTLADKRRIVDKFHAGESVERLAEHYGGINSPYVLAHPRRAIEEVIRWSHKDKAERRRVWRKLTAVQRGK